MMTSCVRSIVLVIIFRENTCKVFVPANKMDWRISCTLWGSFIHTEGLDSSGICKINKDKTEVLCPENQTDKCNTVLQQTISSFTTYFGVNTLNIQFQHFYSYFRYFRNYQLVSVSLIFVQHATGKLAYCFIVNLQVLIIMLIILSHQENVTIFLKKQCWTVADFLITVSRVTGFYSASVSAPQRECCVQYARKRRNLLQQLKFTN